jgi:hypothetical protein
MTACAGMTSHANVFVYVRASVCNNERPIGKNKSARSHSACPQAKIIITSKHSFKHRYVHTIKRLCSCVWRSV